MRKLFAAVVFIIVAIAMFGCATTESVNTITPNTDTPITEDGNLNDESTNSSNSDAPTPSNAIDWSFYNERAEAFVIALADGDFDTALTMFDATMAHLVSAETLKNDIWGLITMQSGELVAIHGTDNLQMENYFISLVTSRHENAGVTLRIVLSEEGYISGLQIYEFITLDNLSNEEHTNSQADSSEAMQRDGFTDYPIIVGEGSSYPLKGLLSIPDDMPGKVPAVVLVHGSGSHDMDSTLFFNKPFKDIADYLAYNGIAVIRYEKRTYAHGEKMLKEYSSDLTVFHETIQDAILAAEILKSDSRIDENRVYIAGISMGGMLAPRIHAEVGNFAGIISLSGSPRTIYEIMHHQNLLMVELMDDGDEKDNALALLEKESYDKIISGFLGLSDEEAKETSFEGTNISIYYFNEWARIPTSQYVNEISVPFLIVQGSEDLQVSADLDFVAWQELLAGRDNATFKLYEGLNHLLMQSAGYDISQLMVEYQIPGQVDIQVLMDIVQWIKAN